MCIVRVIAIQFYFISLSFLCAFWNCVIRNFDKIYSKLRCTTTRTRTEAACWCNCNPTFSQLRVHVELPSRAPVVCHILTRLAAVADTLTVLKLTFSIGWPAGYAEKRVRQATLSIPRPGIRLLPCTHFSSSSVIHLLNFLPSF